MVAEPTAIPLFTGKRLDAKGRSGTMSTNTKKQKPARAKILPFSKKMRACLITDRLNNNNPETNTIKTVSKTGIRSEREIWSGLAPFVSSLKTLYCPNQTAFRIGSKNNTGKTAMIPPIIPLKNWRIFAVALSIYEKIYPQAKIGKNAATMIKRRENISDNMQTKEICISIWIFKRFTRILLEFDTNG